MPNATPTNLVIQETTLLGNTCNNLWTIPNTTSFSYKNGYSNYDTYYYGNILLANNVGQGAQSNFALVGVRTPLPPILSPAFSNASNFVPGSGASYLPYSNGFNFSYRVYNTQIYASGGTATLDSMNPDISNVFNVNSNPGAGLSNSFLTATWSQGGAVAATATYQFSNTLWQYSNVPTSGGVSSGAMTLNIYNIQDQSPSGTLTGFFMKAYANILMTPWGAGSNSNVFNITLGGVVPQQSISTRQIYIENAPSGSASIISIQPDVSQYGSIVSYSNYICGVLTMLTTTIHPFFIGASNIGSYFFASNPVVVGLWSNPVGGGTLLSNFPFVNGGGSSTPFYGAQSVGSVYSVAPISNATFFLWSNGISYPQYTPCNSASFTGTACNLSYAAAAVASFVYGSNSSSGQQNFFYDTYSWTILNATLNSNWSVAGPNYGARVESGAGSNPDITGGGFGTVFNNCNSLLTTYSNELQLSYGAYRTYCNATFNGASNGYLDYTNYFNPLTGGVYNYSNYSGIGPASGSKFRYLTLKYSFSGSGSSASNWTSADIGFIFGDAPFYFDSVNQLFPGISVYYRIVASNDGGASNTNYTTTWLNANSNTIFAPDSNTKNIYGTPTGILVSGAGADSSNLRVYLPTLNYSNINYNFYIRIGIPMNSNVSLKYVYLIPLIQSFNPQALSNLTLSNAQTLPLTNTTMSWYRQNDGVSITNFYLKYGATACNVGGVTYPRRYLNNVISDLGSSNSNIGPNTGVPNYFTWLFTPSNYDTYYWGTVFASNVSGISPPPLLSNTSINRTPLPSNIGSNFGNSLQNICNIYYSNAPPSVVLFSSRNSIISSNLIMSSNLLFSGGWCPFYSFSNGVAAVSNVTVNYSNVGGTITNVTWNIRITCNALILSNVPYTFTPAMFNNSFNSNITSNIYFNWCNVNNKDMYVGDIYRSNFYALTTPAIILTNFTGLFGTSNTLTLTNNVNVSNSITYYIEIQNQAPTGQITAENNLGEIAYQYICGVPVTCNYNFNFWITTSNIGGYFFNPQPVRAQISYPNNGGSGSNIFQFNQSLTPFYSYQSNTSNYSSGPISNVTYFYWSNVTISNVLFASNTTQYSLTGGVSNMVSSNNIGGTFSPYFDPASIAALNCNVRVLSGGNGNKNYYPSVGTFGGSFCNSCNLTVVPYTYELQFVNGSYATIGPGTLGSYLNYNNYFSNYGANYYNYYSYFNGTNTYNCTTLVFSNLSASSGSNKVDTITINFTYSGISSTNPNSLFYAARFNSNTATQSNDSSSWLNMNAQYSNLTITNKTTDGYGSGCNIPGTPGGIYTLKVPDGCGYSNFNLYLMVGLQMSVSYFLNPVTTPTLNNILEPLRFYYNSNTDISGSFLDINYNVEQGLPTYWYNNFSNFLYFSNVSGGWIPTPIQTSNSLMSPLNSNYIVATVSNAGYYSNVTNIYYPNNNRLWTSNWGFYYPGRAPNFADFTVTLFNNSNFNVGITVNCNNFISPGIGFYWETTDCNISNVGPSVVTPSDYQGLSFNFGTLCNINYDLCTWGHKFSFNVTVSNAIGYITSNIIAYSGNQCNITPISITIFSALVDSNSGVVTFNIQTTQSDSNTCNYFTIYDNSNFMYLFTSNVLSNTPPSQTYVPALQPVSSNADHFFEYFNDQFTLSAISTRPCFANTISNTNAITNDYTIATPILDISFNNITTSNFIVTVNATNVPTPPTYTPAVLSNTIWTVTSGTVQAGSVPLLSNNSKYSFYGTSATSNYVVYAQYTMTDSYPITKYSASNFVAGFSPTFTPSYFVSSNNPLNSDSVTQASFPANAISNTCLIVFNSYNDPQYFYYTTTSGDTVTDPTIQPGDTATLQGYGGQGLSTTYNYSYYYT